MPARFAADFFRLDQVTRNDLHAALLLAGLGGLTAASAWLLWSWAGVLATLAGVAAIAHFAPKLPPEAVMRLYRATPLDPDQGHPIVAVVDGLAQRAKLPAAPAVYVIASRTANAFAVGAPDHAVIGITQGLLRRLNLRQLTGVLAHEIAHVANNDLAVMSLADVLTRVTQALSYFALFYAIFNVPGLLLGDSDVSLLALLLLYLAPAAGSLLQLGLARAREFDADRAGASLSGDPAGLASALTHIERMQGTVWEDVRLPVPGRRIPVPSVLRTHPPTEERIRRLSPLEASPLPPPLAVSDTALPALDQLLPDPRAPRLRFPGVWF